MEYKLKLIGHVKNIESDFSSIKKQLEYTRAKLKEEKENNETLVKEKDNLEKKNNELKVNNETMVKEKDDLEKKNNELKIKLDFIKKEKEKLQRELKEKEIEESKFYLAKGVYEVLLLINENKNLEETDRSVKFNIEISKVMYKDLKSVYKDLKRKIIDNFSRNGKCKLEYFPLGDKLTIKKSEENNFKEKYSWAQEEPFKSCKEEDLIEFFVEKHGWKVGDIVITSASSLCD